MEKQHKLVLESIQLLKNLIETPSFSKEEQGATSLITDFFTSKGIQTQHAGNNIWAFAKDFDPKKPTIWLNSHHDTVKPNSGYTRNPFQAVVEDGKLYGLGSNDAGGALVSLIATFLFFSEEAIPFNLLFIASAEEEISGPNGISSLIDILPACELAIVGEPTLLEAAVAEKGLLVIDAKVKGKAGHAAREEGVNAINLALDDLMVIKNFEFDRISSLLGKSKVSTTLIHAGSQHNVVPNLCEFTMDVRITDAYTLEEAFEELKINLDAELVPRSFRLQSSHLPPDHRMYEVIRILGLKSFGSPTLSDQALIPYPSIKIGPGDSGRSHTADEFIFLADIQEGISTYIKILQTYSKLLNQSSQT